MSYSIENLVFEGGGVKGTAYAGALEALHDYNVLSGVKRVAGTSAGAITSCLVSLKYTGKEIKETIMNMNFKEFEDGWDPLRIPTKYGLYEGDAFLKWIKKQIKGKGLSENATFSDFANAGCPDLHVFSTDLNVQTAREFSKEKTPDTIVAEAVRASMSIPLFFKAWQFSNEVPNDHIYVDGGMVINYPITIFDGLGYPPDTTLGFHLDDLSGKTQTNDLKYDQLIHYVKYTFDTLLNAQVIDFEHNPGELKRTVRINDYGISATDFKITQQQKEQLSQSGYDTTSKFLEDKGLSK